VLHVEALALDCAVWHSVAGITEIVPQVEPSNVFPVMHRPSEPDARSRNVNYDWKTCDVTEEGFV
jgi:hypothetical protein